MRNRLSQLVYEKSIILSAKEDTRYDIRTEAEPSPYLGRAILNPPTRITVDFLGWEGGR
ncbi:hypothetical protein [Paraglaciecola chathamensis]|uniref:hypothetical protein n=1 Tax=Paraglaciecola chathamensis TaxID=368405 RepID=UPI00296F7B81|nr:hypothetical protein [Paraglaciecola chathamensis]